MKILITGYKGFVGKNLVETLKNIKYEKDKSFDLNKDIQLYLFDKDTEESKLEEFTKDCDFVVHLAGVNRPKNEQDFVSGNIDFTQKVLNNLMNHDNKAPILITSSIQASLNNPYGQSKKAAEERIIEYSKLCGAPIFIYRLPNVFGKWCKPNYNSAIATFCYNIAHDLPIQINDRNHEMNLIYIDDLISEIISALCGKTHSAESYCYAEPTIKCTLGDIVDTLYSFKKTRINLSVPNTQNKLSVSLYATYLSYLPENNFSYKLEKHSDNRGSFTEMIRSEDRGQFSVNISKPGIIKGNHWHNTKNEKFVVVKGTGIIRFRKIGKENVIEYYVNGNNPEVVDIPTGYTHNIENNGNEDMITFMWASECFNPNKPDTFYEEV